MRCKSVTVLFAAGGLLLVSCSTPDYWTVMEPDWQREVTARIERSRAVENIPEPTVPDIALPDPGVEGPIELSAEQAVVIALRNNRALRVQRYNPVIAGTFEEIDRGFYDPQLFANLNFRQAEGSEVTRVTGEQFNSTSRNVDAVAGVRQTLPTGTDVEVSVEQSRSSSNRSPEQQDARIGLSVTQALLRGFGPAVNLVSVRQSRLDAVVSLYQLRGFTEALAADTESTYWAYALAKQKIAIFERSLELARRQRDEVELRIEVGELPSTEAAAARAEVALRDQALIDARSQLEVQRLGLARLLNPGSGGALSRQLEATSPMRIAAGALDDIDERLALAARMRADLNESKLRLEQDRLETIATHNGLLPRLDVFFDYGKTGFATTIGGSFRDVANKETFDFSAGLAFTQSLGNRAAEARDLAARARREQSAAAVANLEQVVAYDVRIAFTEVERARQQIDATAATRVLLEETAEAERQRLEVGESTSLLVAQAQRDLLESQISEVEAVVNYRLALIRLYLAEGSLLERRGMDIEGTAGVAEGVTDVLR